jgi:hypothetical protein
MPTYTPKALAADFDTNAKRLRKFLRTEARAAQVETPGKGGRWSIDLNSKTKAAMRRRFDAWQVEQAKANAERLAAAKVEHEAEVDDDEVDDDS